MKKGITGNGTDGWEVGGFAIHDGLLLTGRSQKLSVNSNYSFQTNLASGVFQVSFQDPHFASYTPTI